MHFFSTSLIATLALASTTSAWTIYAEWFQDTHSEPNLGQNFYVFTHGAKTCNSKNDLAIFNHGDDVTELPVNMIRCRDCGRGGSGKGKAIRVLEWSQKGKGSEFGHHTYYLDRGGIFVDTNDVRRGTCTQNQNFNYNCPLFGTILKGTSQLNCQWD